MKYFFIFSRFLFTVLVVVIASGLISSCSSTSKQKDLKQHTTKHSAENVLFEEITSLYNDNQHEDLIEKSQTFGRKYPRSKNLAQVYNYQGLAYHLLQQHLQAVHFFQKALKKTKMVRFQNLIRYNLASAFLEAGKPEEAEKILLIIEPQTLGQDDRIKLYHLRSRVFWKRGLIFDALHESFDASPLIENSEIKTAFRSLVDSILKEISSLSVFETLYREYPNTIFSDALLFYYGKNEFTFENLGAAETYFQTLIETHPDSPYTPEAKDYLDQIEKNSKMSLNHIGVLLPLNGKFKAFGEKSLKGIELAFQIFKQKGKSRAILVLEDAGESSESAIKGLNSLFFKYHVSAVIGPLLSKGVDQVSKRAQELGVPLISLAQQPGINGDYIFQAAITPQQQTRSIVDYAINTLNMKNFAIIFPEDKFGREYMNIFWDAVEKGGGKIVGAESYDPKETDFRTSIDRLSGIHYKTARQRELDNLQEQRKELEVTRRNRKTEKYFLLDPIIDYEAVFIPDVPQTVAQILPTFAYRDIDQVQFLGVSTWHSSNLIKRAKDFAEGAILVDAFFDKSKNPVVESFIKDFNNTFNQNPESIEAISYDAAKILEEALVLAENNGIQTRSDFRDQLKLVRNFPGVTGDISYENGQLSRNLKVLTIVNQNFIETKK